MADNRIKTRYGVGPSLWKTGDEITSERSLQLQPHVTITQSKHLVNMGCFSYTFSSLDRHIKIGRYCSISWNVRVMGPQHPTSFLTTSEMLYKRGTHNQSIKDMNPAWRHHPFDETGGGPPVVGNDVWIGQDVLIGPKARLGDGCVVAAGSIVTKDVPPYAIVGGTPARVIRYRFDPALVADLLASRWWEYALPLLAHLPLADPRAFVDALAHEREMGRVAPYQPDLGLAYDVVASLA